MAKEKAKRAKAAPNAAPKARSTTKDISKALAEQMPGWQIVTNSPKSALREPNLNDRKTRSVATGASIDDLRKKFLGDADSTTAPAARQFATSDKSVRVVKVAPKEGGPVRIVEMRGGKLRTISG